MLSVEALLLTEELLARERLLLSEAVELDDSLRPIPLRLFLSGVLLVLEAPEGDVDGDLDKARACRLFSEVPLPPAAAATAVAAAAAAMAVGDLAGDGEGDEEDPLGLRTRRGTP